MLNEAVLNRPDERPRFELDPSQVRAVEMIREADFGILTGGPGTGKTTTLRAALDALSARQTVALASPTGKAARRLSEVTGHAATTIHRLLKAVPEDGRWSFGHHKQCPVEADVVIIDEASMIDIELAEKLLDAIARTTRLILVGDADQLPSVGPGRFFADLIESDCFTTVRLETVHRAAAESWVCSQAPRIIRGQMPDLDKRSDFRWVERQGVSAALEALVQITHTTLPRFAGVGHDDIQVLTPQNVGPAGTLRLNARLQAVLNPDPTGRALSWKVRDQQLRAGDRVIQNHNDYHRGVTNGELGRVVEVSKDELVIDFESGVQIYGEPADARHVRLAYALTVHKYQGSEIPWAVVLCHSTHTRMLTRRWLYTAVTRAKQGVVLVGNLVGLESALRNTLDDQRCTGLQQLLREEVALEFDDPDAAPPLPPLEPEVVAADAVDP